MPSLLSEKLVDQFNALQLVLGQKNAQAFKAHRLALDLTIRDASCTEKEIPELCAAFLTEHKGQSPLELFLNFFQRDIFFIFNDQGAEAKALLEILDFLLQKYFDDFCLSNSPSRLFLFLDIITAANSASCFINDFSNKLLFLLKSTIVFEALPQSRLQQLANYLIAIRKPLKSLTKKYHDDLSVDGADLFWIHKGIPDASLLAQLIRSDVLSQIDKPKAASGSPWARFFEPGGRLRRTNETDYFGDAEMDGKPLRAVRPVVETDSDDDAVPISSLRNFEVV